MEREARGIVGSSLKVPLVQELAKENLDKVPSRYKRSGGAGHDDNKLITSSHLSPLPHQIPLIDMHNLFHPHFALSELNKLHHACKHWGFFELMNHGVDWSIVEKMKAEIEEFFKLPIEEKSKFRQVEAEVEGYGQAFVVSEEQTLDWGDLFFVATLPPHLRKPHLIPMLPPPFRNAIEAYAVELKTLAMKILKVLAKALGMEWEEMEALFEEGMQTMRMNYYPPCPQPELVTGLCPHSDAVGLTILLQVNEKEGLQIKKDGFWLPVSPRPHAFVVNIGDILEMVSNGAYRSIEHRAIVNSDKERLSIATFLNPKMDSEIGPAASLVGPQTPPKYKTISTPDYLKGLFSKELIGKSYLDIMRNN